MLEYRCKRSKWSNLYFGSTILPDDPGKRTMRSKIYFGGKILLDYGAFVRIVRGISGGGIIVRVVREIWRMRAIVRIVRGISGGTAMAA